MKHLIHTLGLVKLKQLEISVVAVIQSRPIKEKRREKKCERTNNTFPTSYVQEKNKIKGCKFQMELYNTTTKNRAQEYLKRHKIKREKTFILYFQL
jgi:peroxiredoxin family protein